MLTAYSFMFPMLLHVLYFCDMPLVIFSFQYCVCFCFFPFVFFLADFPPLFLYRYHLKDVIVGKIYFLLVRIKIKHMEIQIIKRESTGTGSVWNGFNLSTVMVLFILIHCTVKPVLKTHLWVAISCTLRPGLICHMKIG